MTLASQTSKNIFVGDGATLVFAYTFRIFEDADLLVTIQDISVTPQTEITLVLTSDYTVTGADNPTGGNVTLLLTGQLSSAPIATDNITIQRALPLTQPTDYVENDPFPADSHEDALDRSRMIDQQLQEEIDRSLKLPANITGVSTDLPSPVADQILGWNAAADAIVNISQATIAGSSIAFIDHSDTPAAYAGATLDFLRVNAGETAVEFITPDYALITAGDAATDVTATELETLTDGSNADALHIHAGGAEVNNLEADGAADIADTEIPIGTGAGTVAYAVLSGDVTMTNAGVVTIANSVVTVAMLANGTDGELITWDAAGVAATVPVGTSGDVLTSGGTGVAPTFQTPSSGAMTLLSTTVMTATSNSGDITVTPGRKYKVYIRITAISADGILFMRFNSDATAVRYRWFRSEFTLAGNAADANDSSDSEIELGELDSGDFTSAYTLEFDNDDVNNVVFVSGTGFFKGSDNSGNVGMRLVATYLNNGTDVTDFEILTSTGNITGTVTVYEIT